MQEQPVSPVEDILKTIVSKPVRGLVLRDGDVIRLLIFEHSGNVRMEVVVDPDERFLSMGHNVLEVVDVDLDDTKGMVNITGIGVAVELKDGQGNPVLAAQWAKQSRTVKGGVEKLRDLAYQNKQ
jgi:hypothetical protein